MIGLVHDPHIREFLLQVGILAQTMGRRSCEFMKAFEILPVRNPKGRNPFAVRKIEQGRRSPEV